MLSSITSATPLVRGSQVGTRRVIDELLPVAGGIVTAGLLVQMPQWVAGVEAARWWLGMSALSWFLYPALLLQARERRGRWWLGTIGLGGVALQLWAPWGEAALWGFGSNILLGLLQPQSESEDTRLWRVWLAWHVSAAVLMGR